METSSPPPPTGNALRYHYQLVYTLIDLLPPPLANTPEGFLARNNAAIAKAAALLPVNANETDLAAQCIAARAQAEDILRLIRQNADDIQLVMRLNAQYSSMVRTSLYVHARLMRVQAVRHKREALEGAANQDAWTQHIAEQSMLKVVEADAKRQPAASPAAAPEKAPSPSVDPKPAEDISDNGIDSQGAAFETLMSTLFQNQQSNGEIDLAEIVRQAMAGSYLADPNLPAAGRESPARTDQTGHINGEDRAQSAPVWCPDPVIARSVGEVQQQAR